MNPKIIALGKETSLIKHLYYTSDSLCALFYLILVISLQSTLCVFQMRTNHPE